MLRRATLLLLILPAAALAQTTTGTVTAKVTTRTTGIASRSDCATTDTATASASWTVVSSTTPSSGDRYRVATVATGTGCTTSGAVPAGIGGDQLATGATQSISGVNVNSMATMAGVTDCNGANDVTVNLCVYLLVGGSTTNWSLAGLGTFTFQLAIPPVPVVSRVSPGNTQLNVAVAPGSTTTTETATTGVTYTVTCTSTVSGGGASTRTGNAGNIVCDNLTNGTPYTVTASGLSQAGNPGPSSAVYGPDATTTPQPFLNFWEIYKGQGGVEEGGCGAGGVGAFAPVLALLGFLAVRRRRS